MKYYLVLLVLFVLVACNNQADDTIQQDNSEMATDSVIKRQYSETELISFLDSIGKLNPDSWAATAAFYPDSVFRSQQKLNIFIADSDFELLKKQTSKDQINKDLFTKILPGEPIDTSFKDQGFLSVIIHSFSKKKYEKFALEINTGGWESTVYFFDKNRIVAKHQIFHRYGLTIEHFDNEAGATVIYYRQNFESGTGIWWWNYNFFMYVDQTLIPVLNTLENANLQYPWSVRSFMYETAILKTNPLTFRAVYYNELHDTTTNDAVSLLDDSADYSFNWDSGRMEYTADFSKSTLNNNKILSYYLVSNEWLYINSNYDLLKAALNDKQKRSSVLVYLNEVKNGGSYH